MPTLQTPMRAGDRLEPAPHRKRWTRRDCEFLVQNSILTERYELIDGEVIFKMGQKPAHALVITLFTAWLTSVFGAKFIRCQLTITVAEKENEFNEPEPDIVVLHRPITEFFDRHPAPADVRLVVEVADTTLKFDLQNKALLYARAGIEAYWVADVSGRRLLAHRQPSAEGYTEVLEYSEEERISPPSRPEESLLVSELLPPRQEEEA